MKIRKTIRIALATIISLVVVIAGTRPQAAALQTPAEAAPQKPGIPVRIDVVLSRSQAEKKVSSLPFALYMVAPAIVPGIDPRDNRRWSTQSVRMGVDVPVGTVARTNGGQNTNGTSTNSTTTTGPDYRNVGTSIDGRLSQTDDGAFSVDIRVQDTSIFTNDGSSGTQIRLADPMAFRTFTMNNVLTMRNGQTLPFAMATDKITGETLKVDVTVTVLK
jgi:hypothetical protein